DLAGDAGDIPFVGRDAARDDPLEPREVIVAVEGESVHTHPAGDPAADRADLPLDQAPPGVGVQPHPGLAVDPPPGQAVLGDGADHRLLQHPDVGDDVDRVGQFDHGVAGELPRPVPGDLAPAVDVDDG